MEIPLKPRKAYEKALHIFQKEKDAELQMAQVHNNLGIIYKITPNYALAIRELNKAITISNSNSFYPLYDYILDNLGNVYVALGEYKTALKKYDEIIERHIPNIHREMEQNIRIQISTIPNKQDLYIYLKDKAECLKEYGMNSQDESLKDSLFQEAKNHFIWASYVLDELRLEVQEVSRGFWQQVSRPLYESALEVCYYLKDAHSAFYFMEKSKANLLLDALLGVDHQQLIGQSYEQKVRKLGLELRQAQMKFQETSRKEDSIKVAHQRKALIDAISEIENVSPKYHRFRYSSKVVGLEKFRQNFLDDGTHLIHYFYGERAVYILNISTHQSRFYQITRNQEMDRLIVRFLSPFESQNGSSKNFPKPEDYSKIAHKLYQILYEPVWNSTLNLASHVILIPDGELSFVPFEALITEANDIDSYAHLPYLLKKQVIQQTLSASILSIQHENSIQREVATFSVAAFAPFVNQIPKRNRCTKDSLVQLKESSKEFSLIPGQHFTDEDASVQEFKQLSSNVNLIHLATHASAICPNNQINEPYIMFSDGQLFLSELYGLSLPKSPIVILRACQTAGGEIQEGEGVINFIRGFTYAGATNVVASLWNANESVSAELMIKFYQNIRGKKNMAQALNQAKIAYLENNSSKFSQHKQPYYWANFVSIGYKESVSLPSPYIYIIYASLLLILTLVVLGYIWYKKKKSLAYLPGSTQP